MCGIAIEAKLGTDRLAAGEFKKRFLSTVQVTGHKPSRIKGSMVAILNHRQIEALGALPLRAESEVGAEIARDWLLTVRGRVWKAWQARSSPALDNACHVVVFEDLVSRFGSPSAFDALVQSLVGDGFFAEWGLENGSA